jgi:hypothetical protein
MKDICLNIITRTSNRLNGFRQCRESILNSINLKDNYIINHIVITDDEESISYIDVDYNFIEKSKKPITNPIPGCRWLPHNLHFNKIKHLLREGWVYHLDDDDRLFNNESLSKIFNLIESVDESYMLFFQMQYSNGKRLPSDNWDGIPRINTIGSPCFTFHTNWLRYYEWDEWSGGDFRCMNRLSKVIPNRKILIEPVAFINKIGAGDRKDI